MLVFLPKYSSFEKIWMTAELRFAGGIELLGDYLFRKFLEHLTVTFPESSNFRFSPGIRYFHEKDEHTDRCKCTSCKLVAGLWDAKPQATVKARGQEVFHATYPPALSAARFSDS